MFTDRDQYWMQYAIQLAKKAAANNEVPVGAVLISNDQIIGEGCNSPIMLHDPTAHAEIIALRQGASHLKNYRLLDTTMYVTLEPCLMCAGAMVHARIKRLVYGAKDAKTGVAESVMQAFNLPFLNHKVECAGNLLGAECGGIMSHFFQEKRKQK